MKKHEKLKIVSMTLAITLGVEAALITIGITSGNLTVSFGRTQASDSRNDLPE